MFNGEANNLNAEHLLFAPRAINRSKMPILIIPHVPRPDGVLPFWQDQHFIQRKSQQLIRRDKRPLF